MLEKVWPIELVLLQSVIGKKWPCTLPKTRKKWVLLSHNDCCYIFFVPHEALYSNKYLIYRKYHYARLLRNNQKVHRKNSYFCNLSMTKTEPSSPTPKNRKKMSLTFTWWHKIIFLFSMKHYIYSNKYLMSRKYHYAQLLRNKSKLFVLKIHTYR